MTRIIAGVAGGTRLATPPGAGTRPTSERVREGLFSRLDHLGVLPGARVLDLYAGSGALGLEAASRGATYVVLVEAARPVVSVARRNVATVRAGLAASLGDRPVDLAVRAEPVARVLAGAPDAPYDVVLLDPPYDLADAALAADLAALADGWLAPEAVVVVERSVRSPEPGWPPGLARFADRRYGETVVWLAEPAEGPDEGPDQRHADESPAEQDPDESPAEQNSDERDSDKQAPDEQDTARRGC